MFYTGSKLGVLLLRGIQNFKEAFLKTKSFEGCILHLVLFR
jgi:hypothetical protein